MDCDVMLTHCSRNNSLDYVHHAEIHSQIVEKTPLQATSQSVFKNITKARKYNVFVIIIDSVGMTQAERVFLRTLTYMRNYMKAVTFPHMNIIGSNSYPNGMPLLTGIQIDRSTLRTPQTPVWSKDDYLDNTTHLYKVFSEHGYKTMTAENYGLGIAFWPDYLGFKHSPMDHTLNGVYRLIEQNKATIVKDDCFYSISRMLDYGTEFLNAYEDDPKFAFIWEAVQAHNAQNGAMDNDAPLLDFLVKNRKKMDESFIIFVADHGFRYGEVARTKTGMIEHNNPMLTVSVPKDLRNNTQLLETLKTNAKNLQTMWDVRATLFDILESQSHNLSDFSPVLFENDFGSSLFRRQEGVRDCKTLPIPYALCLCDVPRENISQNSTESVQLGRFAIDEINNIIEKNNLTTKCHQWQFVEVKSAVRFDDEWYHLEVSAVSKTASPAAFKVSMMPSNSSQFTLLHVDRLDKYDKRGQCADNLHLYCECR